MTPKTISKPKRDKISAQIIQEIQFSRMYKQNKVKSWQANENMYYAKKVQTTDSRANVELGKMQGYVHTILSKIDNPLVFKYVKAEEADLNAEKLMNALREKDAKHGDWDYKDLLGKKQAVIYGRAIYCYHADNMYGYKSYLENVDVYDFLIDPSAGGMDIEKAFYLGRYGIVKTRSDLKAGKKAGLFIADEVDLLLSGGSNNTEITQEVVNESNRYTALAATTNRELQDNDKFKFWEWYTTFEGERYYALIQESAGRIVRLEKLTDIFESGLYPFWTWAAYPDLTEFWTPSYCDYVREIFMAQSININQMLDNAEQVNKPMKAVNVDRVRNTAQLTYRKNGVIEMEGAGNINDDVMILKVPEITTPITVYNTLDNIASIESGVNNGAKGVAEEDKVGIYEGNQANTADRFGLLNKSYSFGYMRFGKLYLDGVMEKLTKKVAVQMVGADGVELTEITKKDLKPMRGEFDLTVQASNAETQADAIDKRNKLTFLTQWIANPGVNQKKLFEMQADIAGFTRDDIKSLQDVDNYADAELLAEAARDIQRIVLGQTVAPNRAANVAYKQKIVDYMQDNFENLSVEQMIRLEEYILSIEEFIIPNMMRRINETVMKEQMMMGASGAVPGMTEQIGAPADPMAQDTPLEEMQEFAPQAV